MIGTQYLYGGEGKVPEYCASSSCSVHKKGTKYIGVDCSGLIWNILSNQNIIIGRTTSDMSNYKGNCIWIKSVKELIPGDIVLFPGHVGLYIGNDEMIHSPKCGKKVCIGYIKHFNFNKALRLTTNTRKRFVENKYRLVYNMCSNINEAEDLVGKLFVNGIIANIDQLTVNGGTYYIVNTVHDIREDVEKILQDVKNSGVKNARIEFI